MKEKNISIIGLGKLGSSMVGAFASRGYNVIGVDINSDFVEKINQKKPPVSEPKLAEYLANNRERISATQDYKEAVLNSDVSFIIVPTPSEKSGGFSTKYAAEAAKSIGRTLRNKKTFHLVVLTSTVAPGSTEKDLIPALEKYSGKKCGTGFGFCYNPEFIALGNVIYGLLNPDFVLVGESDKKSGDILENFYKNTCLNNPPIKRMAIVNAEITKIALNAYVTTKISYANMLAELCEKIPGGNINVVTDALGCDTRIGRKYLKGALGYGGPCFPRDNRALTYVAKKFGVSFPIAEATDRINKHQVSRLTEKILKYLPKKGKVCILGLSYKTDTNVIEESQGVEIARRLSEKGVLVTVYDPAAMENARKVLKKVIFAKSLKEAIKEKNVIVITTPWVEFKNINPGYLSKKTVLMDCWQILDPKKFPRIRYLQLGVNNDDK